MEIVSDNVNDIKNLASQISQEDDIKTRMPADPSVELPGGFLKDDGALVKYATVRELTGRDEEAIARLSNRNQMLNLILERGLEKLGEAEPSSFDLDSMLAGDRDAIILAIRKVTFGPTVESVVTCPKCLERSDVSIDLDKDIEIRELQDPLNDRTFEVDLRAGKAKVTLPIGALQKQLADNSGKNSAELLSVFLGGCLVSIDGEPCIGTYSATNLGILDRETLFNEIAKRNPGPRLEAVMKACAACGEEIYLPFSLADLFRL